MSCFDVQILDPNINTIEIETCIGDQPSSIDIITYDNISTIEINHCIALLPSDISDIIPVIDILAGSGISVIDSSGIYTISLSNPTIYSSGIVDFLEAVQDVIGNSGLVAGNYINVNYNDSTGYTTVSATGLQPSGNYSVVGHSHVIADVSGLQNALDSKQPSGIYASGIHYHVSSDITDFNSAVSGLIPPSNFTSLTGLSGIVVTNSGTNYFVALNDPTIQLADITDLSSNARTFLLTPSSSNLNTLISDETGSGILVFNASPAFSGIPTVPTATSGTNTNQIASTAFVRTEISNLVDSAPSTLDTLNELAAALGDDPNFATTITNTLAGKANLSGAIFTGTVTIPSGTGNFNSLSVNNIPVSVSGHTHTASNITDFNSAVSGILPIINNSGDNRILTSTGSSFGIDAESNLTFDNGVLSISGVFPSLKIVDPISGPSLELNGPNSVIFLNANQSHVIDSTGGEIAVNADSGIYLSANYSNYLSISNSGLHYNNTPVSISGHTHTSSDITNFNSSVSGLLPVKNIIGGSGINVSSLSGTYTVAVTGIAGLISEEVDDRVSQLLVEGTGVNLTYNDSSGILTIDNLHSEINVLSQEPQGFVNRTDSIISFNDSTRTFTIQPAISGGSYSIYVEGTKIVKNTVETVVLGSGTALNYIHFDTTPPYTLHTKTTGFNFDNDVPIAFIHWNGDINQSTFFGEERHGIRMDSVTHKWIHNTFGMQYISGLSIGGYTLLGNGSSNSHAQIDISDGILYQEDIIIDITDDNGTNSANEFVQPLSPIAYIPTYYHSGSTGQWVRDVATAFPVKYNGTRAQYNLFSGGTWTTPNVTNDRFFAMWIVATNDINDPILAIVGQRQDSSLNSAQNNNTWSDINLINIPTQEIRPLYRLIFRTNNSYTNTPKSSLQSILDLRVAIQSTAVGVVQNDHGSLFGLADDDHSQYIHIDNARTIDAVHTFSNGLNAGGLINAASGNFTSLTVNSTGVSLVGHTHTSSDITNFNSSVSGLLPTITNSGNNRILTSDGTSYGIIAESGLSYDSITSNLAVIYDTNAGNTGGSAMLKLDAYDNSNTATVGARIQLSRYRGEQGSPSGVSTNDVLSVIRTNTPNISGVNSTTSRILVQADGEPSGLNLYTPSRMTFNTSSGPNQLDNSLVLDSDGKLSSNGYLEIIQTNNRLDPNLDSGKGSALTVYATPSGLVSPSGGAINNISSNLSPISPNSNHSMFYTSVVGNTYSELPSGVTNSGAIVGGLFGAFRNSRGANVGDPWYDDNGTLAYLYGTIINYGNNVGLSGVGGPAPTGVNPYTENAIGIYIAAQKSYGTINSAYDLFIADTSYNTGTINNHYAIYQIGNRSSYLEGSLSVDNGLSSPTPIFNLGSVSGNVSINYDINKQIQTATLNGTSTNFTLGSNWPSTYSADVILDLTINSTTTILWDIVDDWYNPVPTFGSGHYLILLRSMGSSLIQGHYIGEKTN